MSVRSFHGLAYFAMVSSMARYRLGLLYWDEGRHDEALEVLDVLVQRGDSGFPVEEALMDKGRVQLAAEQRQAAMVTFQGIVEDHGSNLGAVNAAIGNNAREFGPHRLNSLATGC